MNGFLVPHTASMSRMMSHVQGLELSWSNKFDSTSAAYKLLGDPSVGLGVNYIDMGLPQINGKAYSVFIFCEAGLIDRRKFNIKLRFATGIGFLNKQFDVYSNPLNRAIGSHGNGFMQLFSYAGWKLKNGHRIETGLGLSHFSNGNLGQPNLGVNLPMLVLGYHYNLPGNHRIDPGAGLTNQLSWQFSMRYGMRQIGIDNPRNFNIFLGDVTLQYPQSPIARWRAGMSVFYDPTYTYEKFQTLPKTGPGRKTEVAIFCGHEYRVGRVGLVADLGVYLYRPDSRKRRYYEGVGVKYYVGDFVLITRLKAHLSSADYFEWGLGYTLKGKKSVAPGFRNGWKWIFSGFKMQKD